MKKRITGLMLTITSISLAHSSLDNKQAIDALKARISMLKIMIEKNEGNPQERKRLIDNLSISENSLKSLTPK